MAKAIVYNSGASDLGVIVSHMAIAGRSRNRRNRATGCRFILRLDSRHKFI
jgi:hypothetical protein